MEPALGTSGADQPHRLECTRECCAFSCALHLVMRTIEHMENLANRRSTMLDEARAVLNEADRLHEESAKIAALVKATIALGLREQGLTNKAIADLIGESRNKINDLVQMAIWPALYGDLPSGEFVRFSKMIDDVYGQIGEAGTGWVHARTVLSGIIVEAHAIPLPRLVRAESLDTDAAEFENPDTGEQIIVYSLERHYGSPLFDAHGRREDGDGRGHYRIEVCSPNGSREALPLEILGISPNAITFGSGWPSPEQRRVDGDAFRNAVAAVRAHYGIWPQQGLKSYADAGDG